jgi:hypothetical protein
MRHGRAAPFFSSSVIKSSGWEIDRALSAWQGWYVQKAFLRHSAVWCVTLLKTWTAGLAFGCLSPCCFTRVKLPSPDDRETSVMIVPACEYSDDRAENNLHG